MLGLAVSMTVALFSVEAATPPPSSSPSTSPTLSPTEAVPITFTVTLRLEGSSVTGTELASDTFRGRLRDLVADAMDGVDAGDVAVTTDAPSFAPSKSPTKFPSYFPTKDPSPFPTVFPNARSRRCSWRCSQYPAALPNAVPDDVPDDVLGAHLQLGGHGGQCFFDVEGTLHGPNDCQSAIFSWNGNHPLGLDVQLFLQADPVHTLDAGPALGFPSLVDGDALEDIVFAIDLGFMPFCHRGVQDGGQVFGEHGDVSNSIQGSISTLGGDQGDRFLDVIQLPIRQCRLVLGHQKDDVLSGNIGCSHDGDAGPVKVRVLF